MEYFMRSLSIVRITGPHIEKKSGRRHGKAPERGRELSTIEQTLCDESHQLDGDFRFTVLSRIVRTSRFSSNVKCSKFCLKFVVGEELTIKSNSLDSNSCANLQVVYNP